MNGLYYTCVKRFGWSLWEIDQTDFETLIEFLFYREDEDPNVRIIKGKSYERAKGTPTWL